MLDDYRRVAVDEPSISEEVQAQSLGELAAGSGRLFDTRQTARAMMRGTVDLYAFLRRLISHDPEELHSSVAEAMAIHETSFFRDGATFELLQRTIVPGLLQERGERKQLRIWSAGCSSGQEAYSIAMMLAEHFPMLAEGDATVLGTDVSRRALEYARKGRYRRMEVNRGLPAHMLLKHMVRHGDEWQICDALKNMCEFRYTNLCRGLNEVEPFDLVLLRNVLLYLSKEERGTVFRQVHKVMRPGGCLVLGQAEQAEDSSDLFDVESARGCYFYRPRRLP